MTTAPKNSGVGYPRQQSWLGLVLSLAVIGFLAWASQQCVR